MSLIDNTYFVNEINVPASDFSNLDNLIIRYEKELLIKILGYDLYKLVVVYNASTSPQRIKDIVEGKEYQISGYTYKWNGLINTEKVSLIAYYVYYHWLKQTQNTSSTTGRTANDHEHAQTVTNAYAMGAAWTELIKLLYGIDHNQRLSSLHYFLSENYETYPEWNYEYVGNVNALNL